MTYLIEPEIVLLLSGPVSAGKTTLRDLLLARYVFGSIRSSAYLRELAAKQTTGTARHDLQELGDGLDRKTDYRWVLDDVALPAMEATTHIRRWLFDAVRKKRQVEHFRDQFKQRVFHLHLTAPETVLRERYESRLRENGDPVRGAYERAVVHENEHESRSLIAIADAVIETHPQNIDDVLASTMNSIRHKLLM